MRQDGAQRDRAGTVGALTFARALTLALLLGAVLAALPAAGAAAVRVDGPPGESLAEADLAVSPLDPARVLVVAKDRKEGLPVHDRFFSGDGGSSFAGGAFLPGTFYPADRQVAVTDPVIAFDRRGTAYFASLIDDQGDSVVGVQRSTDGGATFSKPAEVQRTRGGGFNIGSLRVGSGGQVQDDKEWIAVDRSGGARDGTVYVIWQRLRPGRNSSIDSEVFLSSSADGTRFTRPKRISPRGVDAIGPQVAVRPDGRVVATWFTSRSQLQPGAAGNVVATSSSDGGRTFSTPRAAGRSLRVAGDCEACLLSAVETSSDGTALACFARSRGKTRSSPGEAVCSRSSDGRSFGSQVRVAPSVGGSHDLISIASQGARRFWVLFVARGTRSTSVQLFRSDDGGRTFRRHATLATRPYRLPERPSIGDYMGLDTSSDRVLAAYVLPRAGRGSRNSLYVDAIAAP